MMVIPTVKHLFITIQHEHPSGCTCGHTGGPPLATKLYCVFKGQLHVNPNGDEHPSMICSCGLRTWELYGKYHRNNDMQAIVYPDGTRKWFYYGLLHRENDFPAIFSPHIMKWYYQGELHRDGDRPAIVSSYGLLWYRHGELHREKDRPAMLTPESMIWYYCNKQHRSGDRPAEIAYGKNNNKSLTWYVEGVPFRADEKPNKMTTWGIHWINKKLQATKSIQWKSLNKREYKEYMAEYDSY